MCSEPTEGETSPVPSSIDPAITRDPDTGEAWLSFGGGYIYTVKLAADLWLEAGQDQGILIYTYERGSAVGAEKERPLRIHPDHHRDPLAHAQLFSFSVDTATSAVSPFERPPALPTCRQNYNTCARPRPRTERPRWKTSDRFLVTRWGSTTLQMLHFLSVVPPFISVCGGNWYLKMRPLVALKRRQHDLLDHGNDLHLNHEFAAPDLVFVCASYSAVPDPVFRCRQPLPRYINLLS